MEMAGFIDILEHKQAEENRLWSEITVKEGKKLVDFCKSKSILCHQQIKHEQTLEANERKNKTSIWILFVVRVPSHYEWMNENVPFHSFRK